MHSIMSDLTFDIVASSDSDLDQDDTNRLAHTLRHMEFRSGGVCLRDSLDLSISVEAESMQKELAASCQLMDKSLVKKAKVSDVGTVAMVADEFKLSKLFGFKKTEDSHVKSSVGLARPRLNHVCKSDKTASFVEYTPATIAAHDNKEFVAESSSVLVNSRTDGNARSAKLDLSKFRQKARTKLRQNCKIAEQDMPKPAQPCNYLQQHLQSQGNLHTEEVCDNQCEIDASSENQTIALEDKRSFFNDPLLIQENALSVDEIQLRQSLERLDQKLRNISLLKNQRITTVSAYNDKKSKHNYEDHTSDLKSNVSVSHIRSRHKLILEPKITMKQTSDIRSRRVRSGPGKVH